MKKSHWGFVALATIFMAACSNEEPLPSSVGQEMEDTEFISLSGDLGVTKENINNLVKSMKGNDSRSTDYTVSTIVDSLGQPSIYVVNFKNNGGFMLVSATKSHYPILAYNDEGNYNVNNLPPAAKFWQGKMVDDVTASFDMPEDSIAKYRLSWLQYETPHNRASRWLFEGEYPEHWTDDVIEIYNHTRDVMMDSISRWSNRAQVGVFSNGQLDRTNLVTLDYLGLEEELNRAIEACQGQTWYWIEDQWQDVSLIAIRTERTTTYHIPNFIRTNWSQKDGFNKFFPINWRRDTLAAGCATVAAGQIMFHHQWPSTYNWNDMDLNQATDESAQLLRDIANSCEYVEYNYDKLETGINIYDISNMFVNKGYITNTKDGIVCSDYLENGWPIYLRGVDSRREAAHAWICSGAHSYHEYTYLEAYTLTNEKEFRRVYSYILDFYSENQLFMNWGYKGQSNGYYAIHRPFTLGYNFYDTDFMTLLVHPNK